MASEFAYRVQTKFTLHLQEWLSYVVYFPPSTCEVGLGLSEHADVHDYDERSRYCKCQNSCWIACMQRSKGYVRGVAFWCEKKTLAYPGAL